MNIASKLHAYGNWALITGASSGVGKAFAQLFVTNNINCFLISNDAAELRQTVAELQPLSHAIIEYQVCDLSHPAEVNELLNHPSAQHCKIIINCAGIGLVGYFIQHNLEAYYTMLETNVKSLVHITHYFCKLFYQTHTQGAIINVSSANAELHSAVPFSAVYSAEKSMIKYMTEAIAYEMQPYGIDLLCVSCGPVVTGFQEKAGTNVLSWCETPAQVALKSVTALGNKLTIITNPWTRWIMRLNRYLYLPQRTRLKLIAWFFGQVLAKKGQVKL